jgi:peptide/nickel transport system permease protein
VNPWLLAWQRFHADRVGLAALVVVLLYLLVVLAAGTGVLARDWSKEVGVSFAPPVFWKKHSSSETQREEKNRIARPDDTGIPDPLAPVIEELRKSLSDPSAIAARASSLPLGGDKWGRDVLQKTIKGTETSLFVGFAAALLAVFVGTLFGAYAGYYGGRADDLLNWVYNVFTSIPYLLLILAVAAVLGHKGSLTVILILGLTGWTGTFRLVRAEYMKHKVRDYVRAADAVGASNARRMFVHILPNVSHVVLVQLSLHVVLFIKSEVVLSFLGFGVGVDTVSWGSMLAEAQTELLLGNWWQLAAATGAMAVLVTAFSLFTDALRDALDPRLA